MKETRSDAYRISREVSFVRLEGIEPENSLNSKFLLKWKDVNTKRNSEPESDATYASENLNRDQLQFLKVAEVSNAAWNCSGKVIESYGSAEIKNE